MEVVVADVGFGSCSIISLGNNRGIVIDAGSNGTVPLEILDRLSIRHLDLLLLSHSHQDHAQGIDRGGINSQNGSASGIVGHFQRSIDKIGFVPDKSFYESNLHRRLLNLTPSHERSNRFLALSADKPKTIWSDQSKNASIVLFSPASGELLASSASNNPNASSAILVLYVGGSSVLFGGDAQFEQWKRLYLYGRKNSKRGYLHSDVLVAPHHGGSVIRSSGSLSRSKLRWLYKRQLTADYSIVSVGTRNVGSNQNGSPKLPRRDVIGFMREAGSHVLCTQITLHCCADLEGFRSQQAASPLLPQRSLKSPKANKRGHVQHVACAGSIMMRFEGGGLKISRFAAHQQRVDSLASIGGAPLCR